MLSTLNILRYIYINEDNWVLFQATFLFNRFPILYRKLISLFSSGIKNSFQLVSGRNTIKDIIPDIKHPYGTHKRMKKIIKW